MNDRFISVYQAIYATSVVDKYMGTTTINTSTKFYIISLFHPIFTKAGEYSSDNQLEKLTKEFNIHYIACIG